MAKKAAAADGPMPDIPGLGEDPEYALGQEPPGGAVPGAIAWKPQPMPATVPAGGRRVRFVSGQYSVVGPYDGAYAGPGAIRAEMEDKGTPTPEPPKPPTLTAFTALPTSIQAGQTLTLAVTLSAAAPTPLAVAVQTPWLSSQIPVPQGASAATSQIVVPLGAPAGTAALRATLGASSQIAAVMVVAVNPIPIPPEPIPIPPIPIPPTPTPGPFPPVTRTIDLTGKSQADIQKALNAAQPGDGIWLGPGEYMLPATMGGDGQSLDLLNRRGVTLFGAGEATILNCLGKEGIWSRQGGNVNEGNCIRDLAIRNSRRAICALDPQRLWVSRVSMTNVSHGYASERTSAFDNAQHKWPVTLTDCVVRSWASHGMMLHGGETIQRCQLIDTPGNSGSTYSHGLYMQGCTQVLIEDLLIENTSGHSYQLYSDLSSHQANGADDVVMRRITCNRCYYGPIVVSNGPYTNLVVEDLTVTGTVSRNSPTYVIAATNAWIDGFRMKNVVLDGGGEALALQGGQTGGIKAMVIEGLKVTNHSVGIVIAPSGWPYTTIQTSAIKDYSAPGVSLPVRGTSPGLTIS